MEVPSFLRRKFPMSWVHEFNTVSHLLRNLGLQAAEHLATENQAMIKQSILSSKIMHIRRHMLITGFNSIMLLQVLYPIPLPTVTMEVEPSTAACSILHFAWMYALHRIPWNPANSSLTEILDIYWFISF